MASLPQPRQFLTSLINTISDIPLSRPELPSHRHSEPSNPLRAVPQSHRPLLTTLHVLFPTLLLPALDLLDRRLITRLWLVPKQEDETKYQSDKDDEEEHRDEHIKAYADQQEDMSRPREDTPPPRRRDKHPQPISSPAPGDQDHHPLSSLFLVRSSQTPHPRRRKDVLLGGVVESPAARKTYVVRLTAWNCTCAAFAFAAFPCTGSWAFGAETTGSSRVVEGEGEEEGWSFGGVSLGGDGVPCCKHLLACLLAERWEAGFGSYVEERRVGRGEMAGLVADI